LALTFVNETNEFRLKLSKLSRLRASDKRETSKYSVPFSHCEAMDYKFKEFGNWTISC